MGLRYTYKALRGEFAEVIAELKAPIAAAATAAITEAAAGIKGEGRENIARAGFPPRGLKNLQRGLRVDVFPRHGRVSINAAALMFHRIPYFWVFQEGATIRGKPRLWIPLKGTPPFIGRKPPAGERMTPAAFREKIGPLTYIDRAGAPPLLAAPVALSFARARQRRPTVKLPGLERGAALAKGGGSRGRFTVLRMVPLFVGLSTVNIRKRLRLLEIVERWRSRLPELYAKHFKG
jgi:hypothetical protein